MSEVKVSLDYRKIRRFGLLVFTVLILLGYLLQSVAGSVHYSLVMRANTTASTPPVMLQNGNVSGASTIYTNSTSAKVSVTATFIAASNCNYVLKVVNQVADSWKINLKVYNNFSLSRISSLNITFHDGTTSNQIAVSGGSIVKSEGGQYDLPGGVNSTIFIKMSNLQTTATGTSYIYTYLRIQKPNTTTYMLYVIKFEIT